MMKRFLALLMAMTLLCCSAFAESTSVDWMSWLDQDVAQPITEFFEEGTTITTTGRVVPYHATDIAVINFSLMAEGETVSIANGLLMQNMNALREAVIALGVAEEDIQRVSYDLSPDLTYHNTKLTSDRVIKSYLASMVISVRVTDLTIVGDVIDSAMQIGADITHDLAYEYSAAAEAYETALTQAAQDAIRKAGIIAESMGMKLMTMVSVEELSAPADAEAVVQITYLAK